MIVYPPELLPSPDEGFEADVFANGKIIFSTDGGNTMDWADEIAAILIHEGSSEGYDGCFNYFNEASEDEIAAALRKAKADGMRECADWVQQIYGPDLANSFRETASKLSPT